MYLEFCKFLLIFSKAASVNFTHLWFFVKSDIKKIKLKLIFTN